MQSVQKSNPVKLSHRLKFRIGEHVRHSLDWRFSAGEDGEQPLFRVSNSHVKIDPKFVIDNLSNAIIAQFGTDVVDGQPVRAAREAVIKLVSGGFAHFCRGHLRVFAPSLELAWALHEQIVQVYRKPSDATTEPAFQIIKPHHGYYSTREVKLRDATVRSAFELRLHYGNDFLIWKEALVLLLRQKISGIHLFRGEPGTGKTSFIRFLIRELRASHRVYFLPSYEYSRVGNSALIDFFHEERDDNPNCHFVVVMEDAEAILLPRQRGKDFSVSGLLNLSDGLLGEGLSLHIICTVNCELSELDPAVVRPGRLRSARDFRLLSYQEAVELANYLKIPAPGQKREYSLAEIYHAEQQLRTGLEPKTIGFAANG
jgi:hypothetical protein